MNSNDMLNTKLLDILENIDEMRSYLDDRLVKLKKNIPHLDSDMYSSDAKFVHDKLKAKMQVLNDRLNKITVY